jgi:hypothetical protein
MKRLGIFWATLLNLLALAQPAFSQVATSSTAAAELSSNVAAARRLYTDAFFAHPQLYNGPEYIDYSKPYHERTGHQFYYSAEKQPGSVNYNGHRFNDLQVAYDIVHDQVVLSPPSSPLTMRLISEKVESFTLDGRQFIRLVADSSQSSVIRTGYYEVLLDTGVQVLAKRTKRMQEHLAQQFLNVEFIGRDFFFIRKAGAYHPVNRKSSVMRLFSDHGKEMQEYSKAQKLSFKKAKFEASIVQLASYYSSLPPR